MLHRWLDNWMGLDLIVVGRGAPGPATVVHRQNPADAQSGSSIDLIQMNSPCALGRPWRGITPPENDGAKPGQCVSPFFDPGITRDRIVTGLSNLPC
jgi:hypothetical protein